MAFTYFHLENATASPATEKTALGIVDFQTTSNAVEKTVSGKRQKYKKYTANDRFRVAKYGMEHGSRRAARAFQKEFPDLNESTMRTFMKKYVEQ